MTLLIRFPGSKMAYGHAGNPYPYRPNVTICLTLACTIPTRVDFNSINIMCEKHTLYNTVSNTFSFT